MLMNYWYSEKKREHYYKEAKRRGYRARSAFKLLQIQKKFRLIKAGDLVLDLGAAPGSWSEVAKGFVEEKGRVIGVDIAPIKPLKDVIFLSGDVTKSETVELIRKQMKEEFADVIISDMSPDITGNYSVDHARSVWLCEHSLKVAKILLKSGGHLVCKLFEGEDAGNFIEKTKQSFHTVKRFSPKASRKSSSEIYIIAKSFKNKNR